eukprot:CAMPEP_0115167092 /NCGR_PEP_ID=MMETSP0270-20121206/27_1 /TAXON_ID=71861 /ORGANISM="Scrippsiella trochoidea, Strain CCMP3099" /LENGTH=77 /DNA_ID=CAMNT_0002579653 /DNA_START=498 /DNA_END=731 /DNA_ORIENTATION=-
MTWYTRRLWNAAYLVQPRHRKHEVSLTDPRAPVSVEITSTSSAWPVGCVSMSASPQVNKPAYEAATSATVASSICRL